MTDREKYILAVRQTRIAALFHYWIDEHKRQRKIAIAYARQQAMTYGSRSHAETLARRDYANVKAARALANAIGTSSH